jgi:ParB family chromosome partitioning protein
LLGLDTETSTLTGAARHADTMTLCRHLMALPDDAVMAIAAVVMGETLEVGGSVVDELGNILSVDMTVLWQADEVFFDIIRDKQVLGALVAEVAGTETATANAGETGKVLKGIIRDCLAGDNGRKKVEHWVPRWLLFPAANYRPQSENEADRGGAETEGELETV